MFVVAYLLTKTQLGFAGRLTFVGLRGLVAWLSISVSQWNWYKFPSAVAKGIDQVVGFLVAGLVLAALVKPARDQLVGSLTLRQFVCAQ